MSCLGMANPGASRPSTRWFPDWSGKKFVPFSLLAPVLRGTGGMSSSTFRGGVLVSKCSPLSPLRHHAPVEKGLI
jgi:hypothetical protein